MLEIGGAGAGLDVVVAGVGDAEKDAVGVPGEQVGCRTVEQAGMEPCPGIRLGSPIDESAAQVLELVLDDHRANIEMVRNSGCRLVAATLFFHCGD